jgi:Lecithin retinol acyltransferase
MRARYQPVRGAHIYVERDVYSHHGIDCGDGTVIDFSGQGGDKSTAIIRRVTLAEFAQGAPVRTRTYGRCYSPEVVVARAPPR